MEDSFLADCTYTAPIRCHRPPPCQERPRSRRSLLIRSPSSDISEKPRDVPRPFSRVLAPQSALLSSASLSTDFCPRFLRTSLRLSSVNRSRVATRSEKWTGKAVGVATVSHGYIRLVNPRFGIFANETTRRTLRPSTTHAAPTVRRLDRTNRAAKPETLDS